MTDEGKFANGLYGAPHGAASGWFGRLASKTAQLSGRPATFLLAALVVVAWAITGPIFDYSDTWQLVINTGTTIVTFSTVFLIQNTQTRGTIALQLKLDELIIATKGARNVIASIEDASDEELKRRKTKFDGAQTPAKSGPLTRASCSIRGYADAVCGVGRMQPALPLGCSTWITELVLAPAPRSDAALPP